MGEGVGKRLREKIGLQQPGVREGGGIAGGKAVRFQHCADALPQQVEGRAIDLHRADAGQELAHCGAGRIGKQAEDGRDDEIARATGGLQQSFREQALTNLPPDQIEDELNDFRLGKHFAAALG